MVFVASPVPGNEVKSAEIIQPIRHIIRNHVIQGFELTASGGIVSLSAGSAILKGYRVVSDAVETVPVPNAGTTKHIFVKLTYVNMEVSRAEVHSADASDDIDDAVLVGSIAVASGGAITVTVDRQTRVFSVTPAEAFGSAIGGDGSAWTLAAHQDALDNRYATDAELDAHKAGSDHDSRYYTRAQVDQAIDDDVAAIDLSAYLTSAVAANTYRTEEQVNQAIADSSVNADNLAAYDTRAVSELKYLAFSRIGDYQLLSNSWVNGTVATIPSNHASKRKFYVQSTSALSISQIVGSDAAQDEYIHIWNLQGEDLTLVHGNGAGSIGIEGGEDAVVHVGCRAVLKRQSTRWTIDYLDYINLRADGRYYTKSEVDGLIAGVDLSAYSTTAQADAIYARQDTLPSGYVDDLCRYYVSYDLPVSPNTIFTYSTSTYAVTVNSQYSRVRLHIVAGNVPRIDFIRGFDASVDCLIMRNSGQNDTTLTDGASGEGNLTVPESMRTWRRGQTLIFKRSGNNWVVEVLRFPNNFDYYRKGEVDDLLAAASGTDLSAYYTSAQADSAIADALADYDDQTAADARYYTRALANTTFALAAHTHSQYLTENSLGPYDTRAVASTKYAAIGHLHDGRYYLKGEVYTRGEIDSQYYRDETFGTFETQSQVYALSDKSWALSGTMAAARSIAWIGLTSNNTRIALITGSTLADGDALYVKNSGNGPLTIEHASDIVADCIQTSSGGSFVINPGETAKFVRTASGDVSYWSFAYIDMINFRHDNRYSTLGHVHDTRYFQKSETYNRGQVVNEINSRLNNNWPLANYTDDLDGRYYTESEVDALIAGIQAGDTDLSGYSTTVQANALYLTQNWAFTDKVASAITATDQFIRLDDAADASIASIANPTAGRLLFLRRKNDGVHLKQATDTSTQGRFYLKDGLDRTLDRRTPTVLLGTGNTWVELFGNYSREDHTHSEYAANTGDPPASYTSFNDGRYVVPATLADYLTTAVAVSDYARKDTVPAAYAAAAHTHDDRYFTESEITTNHYTKAQSDGKYALNTGNPPASYTAFNDGRYALAGEGGGGGGEGLPANLQAYYTELDGRYAEDTELTAHKASGDHDTHNDARYAMATHAHDDLYYTKAQADAKYALATALTTHIAAFDAHVTTYNSHNHDTRNNGLYLAKSWVFTPRASSTSNGQSTTIVAADQFVRVDGSSAANIDKISNPTAGRVLYLTAQHANAITIRHNEGSGSNKIYLKDSRDRFLETRTPLVLVGRGSAWAEAFGPYMREDVADERFAAASHSHHDLYYQKSETYTRAEVDSAIDDDIAAIAAWDIASHTTALDGRFYEKTVADGRFAPISGSTAYAPATGSTVYAAQSHAHDDAYYRKNVLYTRNQADARYAQQTVVPDAYAAADHTHDTYATKTAIPGAYDTHYEKRFLPIPDGEISYTNRAGKANIVATDRFVNITGAADVDVVNVGSNGHVLAIKGSAGAHVAHGNSADGGFVLKMGVRRRLDPKTPLVLVRRDNKWHEVSGPRVDIMHLTLGRPTDPLETGDGQAVIPTPYKGRLLHAKAFVANASTSGIPTFQLSVGSTDLLSTRLTIDATEKTSESAANAAVIGDNEVAADAILEADVDVAGTNTQGAILTLYWQEVA